MDDKGSHKSCTQPEQGHSPPSLSLSRCPLTIQVVCMWVEAACVCETGVEPELTVAAQTRAAKLKPSRHHLENRGAHTAAAHVR